MDYDNQFLYIFIDITFCNRDLYVNNLYKKKC